MDESSEPDKSAVAVVMQNEKGELSIFDLERGMMPEDEFLAQAPPEAVKDYKEHQAEGMPTGGGKHEALGFYVLGTSGQGPYFVWIEDKLTLLVSHDGHVAWNKEHVPSIKPISTDLCVNLLMPILPGCTQDQVAAAVDRARKHTNQYDTAKVKLRKIMGELGADEAATRKAVAFIDNVKNETESEDG